jgi:hypothetical protein
MIVRKRLVSVFWPGKRQFRTCGPKQAHATFYLLVEDFDRADAEGSVNPEEYQPPAWSGPSSSGQRSCSVQ